MTLSIICPTYNEEKYISQTLESFMNQKFHSFDLEILICDGMSTDKTRDIVRSFSTKHSNIRLVDNPDRKTPFAFNAGLQEASGEYVAILGAHTKYADDYLQVCYEELVKSESVGCTGRVITKAAFDNYEAKICEWVMLSTFGVSSSSFRSMKEGYTHSVNFPVFQKQALQNLGGYNTAMERNQDNDMNQRLLDAGHKLYCTWKTKCLYRPPANLESLFKYAYRNGFWNAKSILVHAKSMRLHHLIPFFFAASIIGLVTFGLLEVIINKTSYLFLLLGLIISLHLLVGLAFSIRSLKYENDGRKIVLPFIFFAFHFSYGWGTLKGFLKGKK
ncbi:MAG TPA: glycosyltransferase family 2 protein [Segetibacter sp.]|jgi:glycosyltransferase involved in cell wall biosynthesis